jgi:CRISPR/Cas system-associated protein Cas10 (large subunit of type III CRISPR-Cas system)
MLAGQLASFLTLKKPLSKGTNSPDLVIFKPLNHSQPNTTFMTEQQKLALEDAIAALKGKLTGDMFADMEVRDEIHNLEMQLKGVKPIDSHFDCVGCGS